ncbi:unnamed protein product [Bursaphelenchus xylophilus]|uniref:(pine wood nematode) hypothetical protein n=1 Tax=Bursaphelenchus xylophilus TaxID=6326 RepID=A0A1I7RP39_BURXY|nr:unnamed protein product [Bursaphelenchus xylophilus]CAG9124523.1 unnamed protein product [Bursaphelenchus xylophilus]
MASALSALLEEPNSPPKNESANVTPVGSPRHDKMLLENDLVDNLKDSTEPLPESNLGKAVDSFIVQWNQLLGDFSSVVGFTPPSPDHVKEKAEYSVKQVREAGLDVTSELHRVMLEWRLNHPQEATEEDTKDLEDAIERQNNLLKSVNGRLNELLRREDPREDQMQE